MSRQVVTICRRGRVVSGTTWSCGGRSCRAAPISLSSGRCTNENTLGPRRSARGLQQLHRLTHGAAAGDALFVDVANRAQLPPARVGARGLPMAATCRGA